jgi:hypothetical protein
MDKHGCVETLGLSQGQIAAFQFYGKIQLRPTQTSPTCPWLLAEPMVDGSSPKGIDESQWVIKAPVIHQASGAETVLIFQRK